MGIIKMNNISLDAFHSQVKSALKGLLFKDTFTDVTLISEDLAQIPAHKIILSSFSSVLGAILSTAPQSKPVLYLRGVKEVEMKLLLHFLYEGEVSMHQEQLQNFLKIVKELGVTGDFDHCESDGVIKNERTASDLIDQTIQEVHIKQKEVENQYQNNTSDLIDDDEQTIHEAQGEFEILDPSFTTDLNDDEENMQKVTIKLNAFEMQENKEEEKVKYTNDIKLKEVSKINQNCQHCSMTFTLKKQLFKHIDGEHKGLEYNCTKCEYSNKKWENLRFHIRKVHEKLFYSCNLCTYTNVKRFKLRQHQQSEHEGMRFSCTQCEYVGKQQLYLKRHVQNEHENTIFVCKKCGFEANGPNGLKRHQRNDHWNKQQCDQCDHQAADRSNLRLHKEIKHERIRYSCKFCDLETTTSSSLRNHEKLKHMIEQIFLLIS